MMLCCRTSCERFAEPAEKYLAHMYFFRLPLKTFTHIFFPLTKGQCLLVLAGQLQQLRQQPTRLLDSGDVLVMDEAVEGDHLREINDKKGFRPPT